MALISPKHSPGQISFLVRTLIWYEFLKNAEEKNQKVNITTKDIIIEYHDKIEYIEALAGASWGLFVGSCTIKLFEGKLNKDIVVAHIPDYPQYRLQIELI